MKHQTLGVNIYGLIREIQEDTASTFREIAAAGFDEAELLVMPKKKQGNVPIAIAAGETIPQILDTARQCGLSTRSVHVLCTSGDKTAPAEAVTELILHLKRQYDIKNYVFSGMFTDAGGAKKWASYLRQIAAAVKPADCRIIYHNHSQEFESIEVDGTRMTALDYFFALAGAGIWLQLDIGWAGIAGDELETAQKYADRIVSLHLKDFIPGTRGNFQNWNMPEDRFCAIGAGEIQTAAVLARRDTFPNFTGSIIIDQDHSSTGMLDDIRTGYQNIRAILEGSEENRPK